MLAKSFFGIRILLGFFYFYGEGMLLKFMSPAHFVENSDLGFVLLILINTF